MLPNNDRSNWGSLGRQILPVMQFLRVVTRLEETVLRVVEEDVFLVSESLVRKEFLRNLDVQVCMSTEVVRRQSKPSKVIYFSCVKVEVDAADATILSNFRLVDRRVST